MGAPSQAATNRYSIFSNSPSQLYLNFAALHLHERSLNHLVKTIGTPSTPPKFKSSPLKSYLPNRRVFLQAQFFWGYVTLRECNPNDVDASIMFHFDSCIQHAPGCLRIGLLQQGYPKLSILQPQRGFASILGV